MNLHRICLGLIVFSLIAPVAVRAADEVPGREVGEGDADALPAGRDLFFVITAGGAHQFEADIDDGGAFSVTRASTGLAAYYLINDELTLNTGIGYEVNAFDFSGTTALGGGDPWDTIHAVRARAILKWNIDDTWSVYGGPMLGFAAESGADLDESITGGGIVGGSYRVSDDLTVGLGVGVFSQIEDDAAIFPILRFDWSIAPQWSLRSGSFDLGSQGGAGVELAYDAADTIELAAGAQYQTRRFRLDDSGAAPGGVGEETIVPVYARLSYNPNRSFTLSVFGGVVFGGEVRLENAGGSNIADEDFDPAPVLGGRVVFRF